MKKRANLIGGMFKKFNTEKDKNKVLQIETTQIRPNISQPRTDFDTEAIVKLADSIRQYGILQPLTIRKSQGEDGYRFELIAGERRLRAAKMLGLKTVPCLMVEVDDEISAELALIENMLRENLGIFEQASAFASLSSKYGLTQEEIARKMSLSQSAVANKIRLLKLSPEERKKIQEGELTERHARAFLKLPPKLRLDAISRVIKDKLNVADTEKLVSQFLSADASKGKKATDNKKTVQKTSEFVCNNIDRYVEKLCAYSNLVSVDKKESPESTIITLTVKNTAC